MKRYTAANTFVYKIRSGDTPAKVAKYVSETSKSVTEQSVVDAAEEGGATFAVNVKQQNATEPQQQTVLVPGKTIIIKLGNNAA